MRKYVRVIIIGAGVENLKRPVKQKVFKETLTTELPSLQKKNLGDQLSI